MVWCHLISSSLFVPTHPSFDSSSSVYQVLPAQTSKLGSLNSQMLIWLRSFIKAAQLPLLDYIVLMQFKLTEKLVLEKALDPPFRLKHVCLEISSKPLPWIRLPPPQCLCDGKKQNKTAQETKTSHP